MQTAVERIQIMINDRERKIAELRAEVTGLKASLQAFNTPPAGQKPNGSAASKRRGRPSVVADKVLAYLKEHGTVTRIQITRDLGESARVRLYKLAKDGVVEADDGVYRLKANSAPPTPTP